MQSSGVIVAFADDVIAKSIISSSSKFAIIDPWISIKASASFEILDPGNAYF